MSEKQLYKLDMQKWKASTYAMSHAVKVTAKMRFVFVRGYGFTGSRIPQDHTWRVDAKSLGKDSIYLQAVPQELFVKILPADPTDAA